MIRSFHPLRGALCAAALAAGFAPAGAQTDPIASKSITRVFAVQNNVFALAEGGREYSWIDPFTTPPQVVTNKTVWPWDGGAQGGAAWSRGGSASQSRQSVIVFANYPSQNVDSVRVSRVAGLLYRQEPSLSRSDSLVFLDTGTTVAGGAAFTAAAILGDTAVFGFGRFGLVYAPLNPEANPKLLGDSVATFLAFPSQSDTAVALYACAWNSLCRADTVTAPAGGLDSVIAVAIDSAAPDSVWLLVATQRGLRRGLWRGTEFPYVALPGIMGDVSVRSVFAASGRPLAWAFTSDAFFFSDDHGASWRVPPEIPGLPVGPSSLNGFRATPQVAFRGDSSFINFTLDEPGIAVFRRDTLLRQEGQGVGGVLINADDGLDIAVGQGSLTGLAVASSGNAAVLAAGASLRGLYYRRLDLPATDFENINRLRTLQGGLAEVITFPTVLAASACSEPTEYSRIGYRLKKDGRVTITVFNYGMEKVRTVVKNKSRRGGVPRSENLAEDRWDGCDENGRSVSVGTYYILVESDQGEKAFGKVITVRGRR